MADFAIPMLPEMSILPCKGTVCVSKASQSRNRVTDSGKTLKWILCQSALKSRSETLLRKKENKGVFQVRTKNAFIPAKCEYSVNKLS